MQPVITSLLDTDLYKFTMWQALLHSHPNTETEYAFVCRNTPAFPLAALKEEVERELDALCALRFTEDELAFLRTLRYLKSDFVDFLTIFHFQRKFIEVSVDGDTLQIVAKGPQVHVMGFEIPVLAMVNELYFRRLTTAPPTITPNSATSSSAPAANLPVKSLAECLEQGRQRLDAKFAMLQQFAQETQATPHRHPFEFFDFGTRRRFSRNWQREVVSRFATELPQYFKGTSNVLLAKELNITPIGTMAHEYLQSYQSFGVRLRDFQKAALEQWVQEYRGDLGIALTDVVGMDAFLADFDLYFAKLFDGLRHDSGDPVVWGEKALAHYAKLRIDANTKRLVFSDGLDFPVSFKLYRHFADRIMTGFGIGTHLSNDCGLTPLNIVMKLTRCNGQPVAKLSDASGKTLCQDQTFLAYLRQVFQHPLL